MRVVVATEDKKMLNGHFAIAPYFMFYNIEEQTCELVDEVEFKRTGPETSQELQASKKPYGIEERIESIRGSDVIFVSAIGGPIADKVIAANVYPIEMNAPEPIDASMTKLQTLLMGEKPLWLQRILKHDFMFEGK